ncbi:hypothetical protein [Neobacillus sp. DY30]|uniref:hypothetical protein n=1 Tax=Neobacillus sp. DY30 TaxID=3047871 RepID=UPI0024BFF302|nr:hypothetical protein [Neobacillus sp. DY30]WHX98156.1 hypothetical protein QNH29_15950 [Neobacillus sp. DY30]
MLRNIIVTFFHDAIWVAGFFFLLHKTFVSERLKQFSKYVILVVLASLLLHSVLTSIYLIEV